jgi:hypothetical protein
MTDNDIVRRDFIDAYRKAWGCTPERAAEMLRHVELAAIEEAQQRSEDGWEFRLSPDGLDFAFNEPGNGPWFIPRPAMAGRFASGEQMDAMGWTRYVRAQNADAE